MFIHSFFFFVLPDRPTHLHEREGDGKRNILWGWPIKDQITRGDRESRDTENTIASVGKSGVGKKSNQQTKK